ncbi:hypothetical protein [Granulicella mallensis]|uniref:Uncharacterized protein n=1 Tax=Granulicella mallensis TaxID=940614 RepID=A0A7W7ZP98_9BACT|nr:hypothetical protein [Granulicella mallensis]MBB5063681.1 hypothetical protein [Granulicella mallensis]
MRSWRPLLSTSNLALLAVGGLRLALPESLLLTVVGLLLIPSV